MAHNGVAARRLYPLETDDVSGWVPASCTLPSVEQPLRVAEFDRLFRDSLLRWVRVNRTRLDLVLDLDAEAAARSLAERETSCCSFFDFELDSAGTELVMRIAVPQERMVVLDALVERVSAITDHVS
jgi:hypothetical protein